MERNGLLIRGGAPLSGEITVSGAKNAALKLMAATLLTSERCVIRDVPDIADVRTMMRVLSGLGVKVEWTGPGTLALQASDPLAEQPPDELVRTMRASVQLLGPVAARSGRIRMAQPGGCDIGERPLDLHLHGLQSLGAEVRQEGGFIELTARHLSGTDIVLDFPSVGATENLMMAAVRARGVTVIHNAAREPEVVELQSFLQAMGARVQGAGSSAIRVEGTEDGLHGCEWSLMPDRIEAATWLLAAAITRGHLRLTGARADHLAAVIARLRSAGVEVERVEEGLEVSAQGRALSAVSVRTQPYPGFPTDVQPQWVALMVTARGTSVVREEIYSRRFRFVQELWRMGADIAVDGRVAVVRGPSRLSGADVEAPDLRGGAALVLAALAAEGQSFVGGVHHLERGYERLVEKLAQAGARVRRVSQA
ncbi:UDP-N-acetylglucosamine 1-carboxyvinyltransferase [Carboxydochorda subterranea]|uniref:UDP-N-acetylglucosamine 1-carboxyvinyltransferase n=1 Tax=Carboxydichorda subterranea TaxID=3109565 RepID=A0ABZ1C102_9FIRM|nr:UDP-N-acetylglucosamine 1-carboxyvinyltransferase [Limnochorda sp. L945t]WRP18614.1 UDP-N-acetylglucosamine 1-carboxyvinyltransferase [Limnochorda sp. L945t]